MAKILLIETSTEVCSVAIAQDGVVLAMAENPDSKSHVALLSLQIEECSAQSGITLGQIDAVAVSRGPGAYTSLRVGASMAKGICYALDKPLLAVDTLQALAWASAGQKAGSDVVFVPMLDARRQEIWLAAYNSDLGEEIPVQPLVLENNSFENLLASQFPDWHSKRFILSGNGMDKVRSGRFFEKVEFSAIKKCSAKYMALLAEKLFQLSDFQDVAYFEPTYMKPPNITTPAKPPF